MSLFEKNSTYVFVANVSNGLSDTNAVSGQAAGSVVLELESGLVEKSALSSQSTTKVRVSQKKLDGTVVKSPWFTYADIISKSSSDYSAATVNNASFTCAAAEQVSYIGYNGTTVTGLGTVTEGETYQLAFWLMHTQGAVNNSQFIKHVPYEVLHGDTESDLAKGLAEMAVKVLDRHMPERTIKVERINSGAVKNALASATAAVTYGSRSVTLSEDESLTLAAGDIIRLGGVGAGTTPCYVVSAISANGLTVTLDLPYQGATETIAHTAVESVTEGSWGLKFTGIAQSFIPIASEYHKVRFNVLLSGFDNDIVHYIATKAYEGIGTYPQVATLEKLAWFNEGRPFVQAYPPTVTRSEADSTHLYDLITLDIKASEIQSETVGMPVKSNFRIIIASESSLDGDSDTYDTALGVYITA